MKTKQKTYELLSMKLKVVYKDRVENEDGIWQFGQCRFDANNATIEISLFSDDGRKLSNEEIELTLRHELFHFILDTLYFRECSANETLVEWLATATSVLNKQGIKI
jgi:hypothetical protein